MRAGSTRWGRLAETLEPRRFDETSLPSFGSLKGLSLPCSPDGLEAPVHYEQGQNQCAIKATVVNELLHAFDRAQLGGNAGLNAQAHSH